MSSHGKLAVSYLVEVIFDLRYSTDLATIDIEGNFAEAVKDRFPSREQLHYNVIEFDVGGGDGWKPANPLGDSQQDPLDVLRYRYSSSDEKKLCQIGKGILSINYLDYQNFDDVKDEVMAMLNLHTTIAKPNSYRRLGMRYINHFPLAKNPESILSWSAKTPPNLGVDKQITLNHQQTIVNMGNLGFQSIVVSYPQRSSNQRAIIVLDIEHFLQFQFPVQPNTRLLTNWIIEAHESIWETFTASLNPKFLEELQYGSKT